MKIRGSSNIDSLYQDTLDFLGITDTSTLPHPQFYRSANQWYRRADTWIWQATSTWEFDDSNYSNLPIATANLVDAQQDYEIPSSARKIDRVEIKNSDGDFYVVRPIDKSQIETEAMSEYYETDGTPKKYDMVGRSLFLYPAPSSSDVTISSGLKMYLTREISEFSTTDTATEPGFDGNFHRIISFGSAYDFSISNNLPDKQKQLKIAIAELKAELQKFYSSRHRDMPNRLVPSDRNNI